MGEDSESKNSLQKALEIMKVRGEEVEEQMRRMDNEIYYMLIRKNLGL